MKLLRLSLLAVVLAIAAHAPIWGQKIHYDKKNRVFNLYNLPPPASVPGAMGKAHWAYFWEFGDGHYATSSEPRIEYAYDQPGDYDVRVCLTPFYSYEGTKILTKIVQVDAPAVRGSKPRSQGKDDLLRNDGYINLVTHPLKELTPNCEVQVVVHYQIPAHVRATEGYLILIVNDMLEQSKIGVRYGLFQHPRWRGLDQARQIRSLSEVYGIGQQARERLEGLTTANQWRGFAVGNLVPGQECRAFFSLTVTKALDAAFIKRRQQKDLNVTLQAMFIPKATIGLGPADKMLASKAMMLDYVRDPNRITVKHPAGPAYYHPQVPQRFTYQVEFENKGTGAARRVEIEIPWDETLDYNTIELIDWRPGRKEGCLRCPEGFAPNQDTTKSCFQIDYSRLQSEKRLVFVFHNIWLHGKKEEGVNRKKYSQGELTFSVKSNGVKQDRTSTRAKITFHGQNGLRDDVRTNRATKGWRHGAWGVQAGMIGLRPPEGFRNDAEGFLDRVALGLYYHNTPLRTGLGWGLSLDYAPFGFSSRVTEPTQLPDGQLVLQLQREQVEVSVLTAQVQLNARLGGWLSAGVGGGPLLPLTGNGRVSAKVFDYTTVWNGGIWLSVLDRPSLSAEEFEQIFELPSIYSGQSNSRFGLLDSGSRDGVIFGEDINSSFKLGGTAHWYAEAGPLNGLTLGIRQSFYHLPCSYKGSTMRFSNIQLYLRFKLFTQKP